MKLKYTVFILFLICTFNFTEAQLFNGFQQRDQKQEESMYIVTASVAQGEEADIHLQAKVQPEVALIGGSVTFTIAINNKGPAIAEDIVARVIIPNSYSITSITVGQGTYDEKTMLWKAGSIGVWKRTVMTIVVTVLNAANLMTTGEIVSCSTKDPDSTPNNGIDTNGNGQIIDDRDDEDDADGQDIKIGDPNGNPGEKITGLLKDIFNGKGVNPKTAQKSETEEPISKGQTNEKDNNIKLPDSYNFSYTATMRITNQKGKQNIVYYMEPDQNYYAKERNIDSYKEHIVIDNRRNIELYFAEIEGIKRIGRNKMDIISNAKEAGAFRDSPNTTTTPIGSKTILGFKCSGYKITSVAGVTEFWVTNEAPATAFRSLFEAKAKMKNSPFTNNSMIMEIVYTAADNSNNNYKLECIAFAPAEKKFQLKDYTE